MKVRCPDMLGRQHVFDALLVLTSKFANADGPRDAASRKNRQYRAARPV